MIAPSEPIPISSRSRVSGKRLGWLGLQWRRRTLGRLPLSDPGSAVLLRCVHRVEAVLLCGDQVSEVGLLPHRLYLLGAEAEFPGHRGQLSPGAAWARDPKRTGEARRWSRWRQQEGTAAMVFEDGTAGVSPQGAGMNLMAELTGRGTNVLGSFGGPGAGQRHTFLVRPLCRRWLECRRWGTPPLRYT
jgi:hypothetical protein